MTKPDDVSQDAWERAQNAHAEFADSKNTDNLGVIIARAIDAAVKAEREACKKVADDHTPPKHTAPLASHVTGITIAQAISNRSTS